MIAHSWPLTVPEGAYVIDGIIYFPEQEEFSSDLLSRHPDCLALPMHEEYVRLYDAYGEEQAETYLRKISNELTSDTLSLDASDEEIRPYAASWRINLRVYHVYSRIQQMRHACLAISLRTNMALRHHGVIKRKRTPSLLR